MPILSSKDGLKALISNPFLFSIVDKIETQFKQIADSESESDYKEFNSYYNTLKNLIESNSDENETFNILSSLMSEKAKAALEILKNEWLEYNISYDNLYFSNMDATYECVQLYIIKDLHNTLNPEPKISILKKAIAFIKALREPSQSKLANALFANARLIYYGGNMKEFIIPDVLPINNSGSLDLTKLKIR